MRIIFYLVFSIACLTPGLAQPTGNQKLFLEISDSTGVIPFDAVLNNSKPKKLTKLVSGPYQLLDASANNTGFSKYIRNEYLHKTLMTDDHRIQVVKNNRDTMNIEVLNAFQVYFLAIRFQKGNFRIYINDGVKDAWNYRNLLPKKMNTTGQIVYDITPDNWKAFEVAVSKPESDYFLSGQFMVNPPGTTLIIPEDNLNFRNSLKQPPVNRETADYNFDGFDDYREKSSKAKDTSKWNYYLFDSSSGTFVQDTLLSCLDLATFYFKEKKFYGMKTIRQDWQNSRVDYYQFIDGKLTLTGQSVCVQYFPHSERMDCSFYELVDGKMVFKELIRGCE